MYNASYIPIHMQPHSLPNPSFSSKLKDVSYLFTSASWSIQKLNNRKFCDLTMTIQGSIFVAIHCGHSVSGHFSNGLIYTNLSLCFVRILLRFYAIVFS